ncbi:hypothetical protein GOODEAATRI_016036 [Goodea atripinnis]|uniref:Uncharacterized protein n=1 Tax=Goodea atripinnis TaxID=208336 RepID=A0ABV0N249_9TELE
MQEFKPGAVTPDPFSPVMGGSIAALRPHDCSRKLMELQFYPEVVGSSHLGLFLSLSRNNLHTPTDGRMWQIIMKVVYNLPRVRVQAEAAP